MSTKNQFRSSKNKMLFLNFLGVLPKRVSNWYRSVAKRNYKVKKGLTIAVVGSRGIPNVQGGIETHCEQLYPLLAKQGINIIIYARKRFVENKSPYYYKGCRIIPLWHFKKQGMEAAFHTFISIIHAAIYIHPTILHIHAIGPALFTPLARLLGMKVVFTDHSQNYLHFKWGHISKRILKLGEWAGITFSNQTIAVSQHIRDMLIQKYGQKNVTVIRNGVRTTVFKPSNNETSEILNYYGLKQKKYIFTLGRFEEGKGFHDLINAFSKINNKNDYKLVIAGDAITEDSYSEKIKKMAHAQKNDVVLTGFIKGTKLSTIFASAGLFVFPSYFEGLPIVLLEAMSYNLDILCSDIAANTEIPLPKECFFPVGNVNKIAYLIEDRILHPCRRDFQDILNKYYNWEDISLQTLKLYKTIA